MDNATSRARPECPPRVSVTVVKFAYADPPYLGQCSRYGHRHEHPYGCWNGADTYEELFRILVADFPDGWAVSASSPSLRTLLPLTPPKTRVMAWTKPFAQYRPNVNPAYAWEPVLVYGGRRRDRTVLTLKDWVSASPRLKHDPTATKPEAFFRWLLDVLNVQPEDELVDIFPGTGILSSLYAQTPAA